MNILMTIIVLLLLGILYYIHTVNKNADFMQLQETVVVSEHIYNYKFTKEQIESIENYFYRYDGTHSDRLRDTMELCRDLYHNVEICK